MKFLTLLSFLAFVIALLCSSAFTAKRAATLDEVIKALGSLYQQKLFSVRDEGDDLENIGGQIIGGIPVTSPPDLRETVTVPRYHYCMKSIPYCVTFYGSIIVQDKPLRQSGPQKKNIRNTPEQLCVKNVQLGACPDTEAMSAYKEIVEVSGVDIPDFCFPGNIELEGNLEVLRRITENATVYVQMYPTHRPVPVTAACSQIAYSYNVCDLLERNISCPMSWNSQEINPPLPCSCFIDPGNYTMHGFQKMVDKVDFFGLGERSGFAVVSSEEGKSCFSFNFTGTAGSF